MKLITKIKRLSADYRKHENEMAEIELKKMIEGFKTVVHLTNSMFKMQLIANQPKMPQFETGGIIPLNEYPNTPPIKPHPIKDETLQKIKSDIENSNGKINIKIYPDDLKGKH